VTLLGANSVEHVCQFALVQSLPPRGGPPKSALIAVGRGGPCVVRTGGSQVSQSHTVHAHEPLRSRKIASSGASLRCRLAGGVHSLGGASEAAGLA